MGDVIKFRDPKSRGDLRARADGKTLCRNGHHRWQVVTGRRFDVKLGKLVTLRRCQRCGKENTQLT